MAACPTKVQAGHPSGGPEVKKSKQSGDFDNQIPDTDIAGGLMNEKSATSIGNL